MDLVYSVCVTGKICNIVCVQLVGKLHKVKIPWLQTTYCSFVIEFFHHDISIHTSVVNIFWYRAGVLRAMRIDSVVHVRTLCSLST